MKWKSEIASGWILSIWENIFELSVAKLFMMLMSPEKEEMNKVEGIRLSQQKINNLHSNFMGT